MKAYREYIQQLAHRQGVNDDQILLYWKGRVALYAALKAIGVGPGDEVILPAFTCVVVPNAIKYLGATPVYVDVHEESYNTSLELIQQQITPKTKVVLVQNTFGLSSQVDEISDFCTQHGLISIEDCTHGFGGKFKGKPNGSYCDFAFFSSQWNKPFSTGIGGILQVNNRSFLKEVASDHNGAVQPSLKDKLMLKALLFAYNTLLKESTYWTLVHLYRKLTKYGLVIGSSDSNEIEGIQMPVDYNKDMSHIQCAEGIKNLKRLDKVNEVRMKSGEVYTQYLKSKNKKFIPLDLFENHSFLKYPLRVKERTRFLELAEKHKIKMGEWFSSPLHPVENNLSLWNLEVDDYPSAKTFSSEMVNLPTDIEEHSRVLAFLDEYEYLIL